MKILFFDNFSLWVCARRMEQGTIALASSEEGRVQLTREEFALLWAASILPRQASGSGIAGLLAKESNSSQKVA